MTYGEAFVFLPQGTEQSEAKAYESEQLRNITLADSFEYTYLVCIYVFKKVEPSVHKDSSAEAAGRVQDAEMHERFVQCLHTWNHLKRSTRLFADLRLDALI